MNKDQMIEKAKELCKSANVVFSIEGKGNARRINFETERRYVSVWFPVESRGNDREITDLKDTVSYLTGEEIE